MKDEQVTLVEVGPRDGFQSLATFIPTVTKASIIRKLYDAGVRRIEATSFVSEKGIPQLADAAEVVAAAGQLPGLDVQVLVPTVRHAERAMQAGARHLVFVLSVSERHNRANVRRTPAESIEEYRSIVRSMPADTKIRVDIATAFDCPYEGLVPDRAALELVDRLVDIAPDAEIAFCDTTGRTGPAHVSRLFSRAFARYPALKRWAFHPHDTYGLAAANVLSAWNTGVRVFDASIAGLGGCPFAPGATGNAATEDLVWMFNGMGVQSGLDLDQLVATAAEVATLPGAQIGGRVRDAVQARSCREQAA